jgi:hypothetical protein
MTNRFFPRPLRYGLVVVLIGASAMSIPVSVASAASSSSPTQEIITNGFASVNTIRSFFFCETTACKKDKSAAASSAAVAMNYLEGEASALKPSKAPKSQRAVQKKFIVDITSLAKVYSVYASETTATEVAHNTGVIYYESANVGSDIYVLTSKVQSKKMIFADWGVGAVAVLYTMQVDTQLLSTKNSSVASDVAADTDLKQDAAALKADANGPSKQFNTHLVKFAKFQIKVSKVEIDVLEKKKTSVSSKKLQADLTSLTKQFATIVDLQKKLSK